MFKRIRAHDARMRKMFYDGPAVFNHPGRRLKGYRSPSVMLAHWVRAFAMTYFTLPGRVLFLLSGLLLLAGMTSLLMPIYFLSFAVIALFMLDFVVGWLLRPKLEVERVIASPAAATVPVRIGYRVRNVGRRSGYDLSIDSIPWPAKVVFAEENRLIPVLPPEQEVSLQASVRVPRRGRYFPPLLVVDSAFPFGLWRWGRRGQPNKPLLIYPNFTPLNEVRPPGGLCGRAGGSAASANASESNEFLGCRQFRYGDSARHVHALSSARLRELVVKEFRNEELARTAIMVDTFTPMPPRPWRWLKRENATFEAALSLAAAISDNLIADHYQIDFFVPGFDDFFIEGGRGDRQLQEILETIAALPENHDSEFHGPSQERYFQVTQIGALIMVLLDWDSPRQEFARELQHHGVAVKVVVVNPSVTAPPADAFTVVTPADVLAGRVRDL